MSEKATQRLIVENVRKSFGALVAVDNVSFSVAPGEIFGIAGPNGSGKSTLFNIISAVPYSADGGRVVLDGEDLTRTRPNVRFRKGLARTFQTETAFECLTVYENIELARVYGKGEESREDIEHILDLVGLAKSLLDRSAAEISVAEKKKLMLATAIAADPKIIMLDEPAAGLTKSEIDEIHKVISEICSSGISIVLVEHVMPLLLSISKRILILNHGQEVMTGPPDLVINDDRVIEAYLGQKGKTHGDAA